MGNPYEERARAIKSFKLARVIVRACRTDPDADLLGGFAACSDDDDARVRTAFLARVPLPSDQTWEVATALAAEWLRPVAVECKDGRR